MKKEPELKARDKVVVRMTREGAVEENLTAGTEQRVSKRLEDTELVKPVETAEPSEALSAEEQKKVQMRRQQRQFQAEHAEDIVIDYDAPINEDEEQYQTYFLNMVDESDLLALLDDDTAAALTTCNCKEKCAAGQVNTDCPVCKTNMSECTGTAPVTPEPDKDTETDVPTPKPEKKSNIGMILIIFVLAGAAGAAYYYIKFVKGRKPKDEDLDFFDDEGYEEEPYINEDEEPQIAEDAETEGDED